MNQIWLNAVRASGSTPWYLAGGAPTPVAVYEPAAAASLAASYIPTIATLGNATLDPAVVGGVAPTFSGGWVHNGTSQYLKSGVVPASGYSYLIVFSGAVSFPQHLLSSLGSSATSHVMHNPNDAARTIYWNGGFLVVSDGGTTAGVLATAGNTAYKNGVSQGTMAAWSGTNTQGLFIGARNNAGSPEGYFSGTIKRIAMWDTNTGHATWMPAVCAAVGLL